MAQPPVSAFQDAIRHIHGCESRHAGMVHVVEVFEGQTAWEGDVQTFILIGHPEAIRCYAWSHTIDGGPARRFVAVLEGGGIDSPQAAVRATIVKEHREGS